MGQKLVVTTMGFAPVGIAARDKELRALLRYLESRVISTMHVCRREQSFSIAESVDPVAQVIAHRQASKEADRAARKLRLAMWVLEQVGWS